MKTTTRLAACSCAIGLLAFPAGTFAREKTDIVYLRNGDRVSCEIKRLERGRLQVSTDSMGTVYIEWKDIARVTSPYVYIVEMQDGSRVDGSLAETAAEDKLLLKSGDAEHAIDMPQVVWLDPLQVGMVSLKGWDGAVSAGFDMTKANNDTSLTASFNARHRAEDFALNFNGSLYTRSQDDAQDSTRANLGGGYRGLLDNRWYWTALGGFERNDELGIDLRSLAGAGYGRYLVQSGRSLWSLTGGLAVVNEQRAGDEDSETSLESFLSTDFEFFTYDTPKTSFNLGFTLYPSVSDWGRVRSNLDLGLRQEIITDLFVELSFYDSFDSRPPAEGEKNDYGIVTSLGYTF